VAQQPFTWDQVQSGAVVRMPVGEAAIALQKYGIGLTPPS